MQEGIGVQACFSSTSKLKPQSVDSHSPSPQSLIMSIYQTKIASHPRHVTITWCKNLLLHGLSISVDGPNSTDHYHCKVELKPWYFWRKHGSKHFTVDGKTVDVVWDLKGARFNGEVEPVSDYYVAIVCENEVVLVVGDLKKDAFRKTGCRPALIDPILLSRKEHVFGKKKFCTRTKFSEREKCHEISVECSNNGGGGGGSKNEILSGGLSREMEIRIDGEVVSNVKHLEWKFRGNELVEIDRMKVEVYWDVHDWLFGTGLRHAMFLFKPTSPGGREAAEGEECCMVGKEWDCGTGGLEPEFCLFLYAWKVE